MKRRSEKKTVRNTSEPQTSLGENSPTVSMNTGWGFLRLSEGFGVDEEAAGESLED